MRLFPSVCGAALLLAAPLFAAPPPPPSADRIKSAAAEYDAARRAYGEGKFEDAAVHFENAYHDAPNVQALRSAILARKEAGQLARAATLASLAITIYASDETMKKFAADFLTENERKLYKVSLACTPECGVAADGRVVSLDDSASFVVFFDPGPHTLVVSWPGDRSKETKIEATAKGATQLSFEAPPMPVTPPPQQPPQQQQQQPAAETSSKPFGPAVFFVGVGLTAVSGGILIWSGIDTINNPGADTVKQKCAGQGESCPEYQQGLASQTRTNVLIGVTTGLGLLTAITGLFLTQWSSPSKEQTVTVSFGLGSASIAAKF